MKHGLAGLLLLCFFFGKSQPPVTRNIPIKITPYANCNVYLASYYGLGKIYADTARLNGKGEGVFKGTRRLTSGMYFVVSPKNTMLFELMLDSAQQFSITADTTRLADVQITGSPENALFREYSKGIAGILFAVNSLNQAATAAKTPAEAAGIQQRQQQLNQSIQAYKDYFIKKAPHSLLALLLIAGRPPDLPADQVIKTRADTIAAAQYIKKHYWNDVPFNDDRLLYTSFFEPKIDNFFKFYVPSVADSVIKELQYILLYARTGKQMYPYLLQKFTNRYFNPEFVGQNKVFLYLFNDFYMRGDTVLLNPASKKLIYDRAYQLMANQVGDPAPPLNLTTAEGKVMPLYSLQSPYTLIVFWDPTCSHCQAGLPRIDSMYRTKWKRLGMKIYSVNINAPLMKQVTDFAQSKNLSADWIYTYQPEADAKAIAERGMLNYFQTYDVTETPTLYLLDAQKHIIARHLHIEQIDAIMDIKTGKH